METPPSYRSPGGGSSVWRPLVVRLDACAEGEAEEDAVVISLRDPSGWKKDVEAAVAAAKRPTRQSVLRPRIYYSEHRSS